MKTVAQLSQRTRNKYILLAKLGVPIEVRGTRDKTWGRSENADDLEFEVQWLRTAPSKHHDKYYIRRARLVKAK